jgi:hypothetical protein
MKSQHTKAHTFASRTSPNTDQSLQKSVLFSHPRRNSIYFSPALRCFNFFATAQQPTTTEYLDRTKQDPDRLQYDADKEARTGNSGFKKLAVQWLIEVQFFNQTFVLADSFVLRNRQLLKPAKRYRQP